MTDRGRIETLAARKAELQRSGEWTPEISREVDRIDAEIEEIWDRLEGEAKTDGAR